MSTRWKSVRMASSLFFVIERFVVNRSSKKVVAKGIAENGQVDLDAGE